MRLCTLTQILLGLTFMTSGFIKSKRFGKRLTPELFEEMEEQFEKMDKALKDFPGKASVPLKPAQFQELFAYTDMISGFLLLTGNLVWLATVVLLISMSGLEYTMCMMNYPLQYQAVAVGIIVALVSTCSFGRGKEKED